LHKIQCILSNIVFWQPVSDNLLKSVRGICR